MAEPYRFSAKQVGIIVSVAVCCCLMVFWVYGRYKNPYRPWTQEPQQVQFDFSAAYDKAYTEIQLERTRRAAEDAARAAREARYSR